MLRIVFFCCKFVQFAVLPLIFTPLSRQCQQVVVKNDKSTHQPFHICVSVCVLSLLAVVIAVDFVNAFGLGTQTVVRWDSYNNCKKRDKEEISHLQIQFLALH